MNEKWKMPFMAADGGAPAGGADPAGDKPDADAAEEKVQGFDELLKNETYKKEFNARVEAAVNVGKAAWEQEQRQAAEQKKMEELPDDQKAQALFEAEKQRADKLEAEKNAILLKNMATSLLTEKKLPAGAADFVIGKDEEQTAKNVEAFQSMFATAVGEAVKEKVPGYTPKAGTNVHGSGAGGFMNAVHENQAKRK